MVEEKTIIRADEAKQLQEGYPMRLRIIAVDDFASDE